MKVMDSVDVFWVCISLLKLPFGEMIERLNFPPKLDESVANLSYPNNAVAQLLDCIVIFSDSWCEEFYPNECSFARALEDECNKMDRVFEISENMESIWKIGSWRDLFCSPVWGVVRDLANKALEEVGLPPLRIEEKIDFWDFLPDLITHQWSR